MRAFQVCYSDVGEGGVAVNCEKKTIFPEHPVSSPLNVCVYVKGGTSYEWSAAAVFADFI